MAFSIGLFSIAMLLCLLVIAGLLAGKYIDYAVSMSIVAVITPATGRGIVFLSKTWKSGSRPTAKQLVYVLVHLVLVGFWLVYALIAAVGLSIEFELLLGGIVITAAALIFLTIQGPSAKVLSME